MLPRSALGAVGLFFFFLCWKGSQAFRECVGIGCERERERERESKRTRERERASEREREANERERERERERGQSNEGEREKESVRCRLLRTYSLPQCAVALKSRCGRRNWGC